MDAALVEDAATALFAEQWATRIRDRIDTGQLELVVVAGSHSYGLQHDESDLDLRGFWSAEPLAFLGIHQPKETIDVHDPDIALQETGKFCRLALNANPTVLETLVSPYVIHSTEFGRLLCAEHRRFLSNKVRSAYLGYANSQFERLKRREDGSFSADTRKRTVKHALHMFRLIEQGEHLVTTGELPCEVEDPDRLRELSALPLDEMIEVAEAEIRRVHDLDSVLPDEPDTAWVDRTLAAHRRDTLAETP